VLTEGSSSSSSSSELSDAKSEATTLVELLEGRQAALTATLESQFAEMRASVWQSEDSLQAAVQVGLGPRGSTGG
jgi:MoxR-like ATPase